jgi:hypothetical protein
MSLGSNTFLAANTQNPYKVLIFWAERSPGFYANTERPTVNTLENALL